MNFSLLLLISNILVIKSQEVDVCQKRTDEDKEIITNIEKNTENMSLHEKLEYFDISCIEMDSGMENYKNKRACCEESNFK